MEAGRTAIAAIFMFNILMGMVTNTIMLMSRTWVSMSSRAMVSQAFSRHATHIYVRCATGWAKPSRMMQRIRCSSQQL